MPCGPLSAAEGNIHTMLKRKATIKPPWIWARIVKACPALKPTAKLVYLEHMGLIKNSQGCTASASRIGQRLALARVTIERMRKELRACGLLRKRDRGIGRTASWFVELPVSCQPRGTKATDDEVQHYAECLAVHIKSDGDDVRGSSLMDEWGEDL